MMIYTHALARPDIRIVSPLGRLSMEARRVKEPKVEVGAKVEVKGAETTEAVVAVEAGPAQIGPHNRYHQNELADCG